MTFFKKTSVFLTAILILLLVSACSENTDGDNDELLNVNDNTDNNINEHEEDLELFTEPITLKVSVGAGEEAFEELYKKPVEDKYPNLTVEQISFAANHEIIEDTLLAGEVPDIIYGASAVQLHVYEEYDLLTDHRELIERHNLDMSLFDDGFIELIQSHSEEGELWALPRDMTRYALHYNKDIFDRFGVDYPVDGMTWQEVIDLSKEVTGEIGDVEYEGLKLPIFDIILSTLSTPYPVVDFETDEPLYTSDPQFNELFSIYQQVYHEQKLENPIINDVGAFIGDQTLAMLPIYNLYSDWTGLKEASDEGMNWDIVTFPVWDKENPRGALGGGIWLGVTDYSENKDEALKVLEFWLDNENVENVLEGNVSAPYHPTATKDFIDQVGVDEGLKDKNVEALFKYPTSEERVEISKFQYDVYPLFVDAINEYIDPENGIEQDINTVLRELQEETEALIEELRSKD